MDARMKFLEHELEEKEREMDEVKREKEPGQDGPNEQDERILALERRVRELEAMLKGLMDETLDLKSVTRKIARTLEEHDTDIPGVASGQKIGRHRPRFFTEDEGKQAREQKAAGRPSESPAPEAEPPVDTSDMELIMQPDGTLKPEKRVKNDYIVASSGYAPVTQMKKGKIESRIYEAPEVDPKSGAVISKNEKDDDDTTARTIRRKK
ncbi:MAG: hypothetical protein D5R96_04040 [Methanocalculus sp. MSAO_Arc2]|nr:MAG: hypothetical protein D5R96_04040 [Methanocalculus sp. MSAO_Arc2]